MIIKNADNKTDAVATLEQLLNHPGATPAQQKAVQKELNILRAGIKGENEAAYQIGFDFKDSEYSVVIHDLRLDINGRVAQIDHLLIGRGLIAFVLETKHFNSGLKINDNGEFLRWNDYKKTFEGMASPLEQNERHIAVLKDAFKMIDMPSRLGLRLMPTFHSFVVVSSSTRIDRPKKFDTGQVIKADSIKTNIQQKLDKMGMLDMLGSATRLVSYETLEDIARKLCALHTPIYIDYKAKFGISDVDGAAVVSPVSDQPEIRQDSTVKEHACRKCGGANIGIQYGKFGYYFKCLDCDGNTPIKVACDEEGCKARIRKEGNKFFRECVACDRSSLYFTNS
ncbi:MAG TPA: nuclease-related domain-containing protein [Candidatus Thiothrix moscowensis]|uniref:nuclease-related domain-containing protein n=1 Tax=unclassified Thiothrix TaxID=2636184 RepID=UPI0025DCE138|nr:MULTISPECIES: nuclease-related domain-containing protein [unclassified Thiothrix]HRJ54620.1 nuclease-related domain-containing protein [Candidatus Thiothrix moscowensis]HRJ95016.1 nuclease-related domain-containing protein [Candidatus Thiothrix moscowensis]